MEIEFSPSLDLDKNSKLTYTDGRQIWKRNWSLSPLHTKSRSKFSRTYLKGKSLSLSRSRVREQTFVRRWPGGLGPTHCLLSRSQNHIEM